VFHDLELIAPLDEVKKEDSKGKDERGRRGLHLSKSDMKSLDVSFNCLLMKLFKTTYIGIINDSVML